MSTATKKSIQLVQLSGNGGAVEISLEQLNLQQGLVWIWLDLTTVKQFLNQIKSNSPLVEEVLSAKATRPRTLAQNDALLATFRGVNLTKGSKPEDMVSIRLWMHKNMIVTVQHHDSTILSDIHASLCNGIGPKDASEFLEELLYEIVDKSAEVVSALGNKLDHIEDGMTENFEKINRIELNHIRRRIILLRRYLIPQREAINRIPADKLSWMNEINLMHLREITDASTRILEDIDAERERSTLIHEELFAMAQEAMNKKIYLLSMVAVIFMPLGFITGLLGINVGGIPGASFRFGFATVCLVLLVVFGLQLIFLKKKRFF
ncbi:MAG: hypothetical protein A3H43_04465 [Gammaproteobacteria bacterium RIFCSPLOWO2_02_FULL_42_9]|nr:MAG: hypothetical protein A3H43_04465 [Gammaproteobacteria bacterium RIFCSPLOWO2_02_FULL_42_9]